MAPSKYSPSSHRIQTMDVYQRCENPGILNPHFVHPPATLHPRSERVQYFCPTVYTLHPRSPITPATAIICFTVTSFAACDVPYCNLDDRHHHQLICFVCDLFLDTRTLIHKCGDKTPITTIPTINSSSNDSY